MSLLRTKGSTVQDHVFFGILTYKQIKLRIVSRAQEEDQAEDLKPT